MNWELKRDEGKPRIYLHFTATNNIFIYKCACKEKVWVFLEWQPLSLLLIFKVINNKKSAWDFLEFALSKSIRCDEQFLEHRGKWNGYSHHTQIFDSYWIWIALRISIGSVYQRKKICTLVKHIILFRQN